MWSDNFTDSSSLFFQSSATILACIASVFLISLMGKAWRKPRLPLPPGPRGLPLVAYLPFLGTDPHVTFAKLSKIYGPIYKVWLGRKLHIVLTSPEVVKEVVRDKDTIFANRGSGVASDIITYGANDIAFRDYGPEWRKLRKIFSVKLLGHSNLDAGFKFRKESVRKGVKEVYEKVGTSVGIGQVGFMTVATGVMTMIWGATASVSGDKDISRKADLKDLLDELMVVLAAPNVSEFFPALAWLDLQGLEARSRRVFNDIDLMFEAAIARIQSRQNGDEGTGDFLGYLMKLANDGDAANSLSKTQIKAMLLDTAVGGTDTTATLFEWTLSELLLHPQALKAVQDELTEVVRLDTLVDESHLSKLTYLDAAVKETHRLHPAFPLLLPRRPSEATEVGGYTIPKGVKVFINVWAMHRDPTLWDDPLEFKPERFLDGTTKWDFSGNDLKYLPFGTGRRTCPGLPLAERALMYTLATFLHCFNWEVPNGEINMQESFGVVMKKKEPLVAIPTPRLINLGLYA